MRGCGYVGGCVGLLAVGWVGGEGGGTCGYGRGGGVGGGRDGVVGVVKMKEGGVKLKLLYETTID